MVFNATNPPSCVIVLTLCFAPSMFQHFRNFTPFSRPTSESGRRTTGQTGARSGFSPGQSHHRMQPPSPEVTPCPTDQGQGTGSPVQAEEVEPHAGGSYQLVHSSPVHGRECAPSPAGRSRQQMCRPDAVQRVEHACPPSSEAPDTKVSGQCHFAQPARRPPPNERPKQGS